MDTPYPLIPAKAGTQMTDAGVAAMDADGQARRLMCSIWVPAFAGMSGNGNA
jgi:hypothetical protein